KINADYIFKDLNQAVVHVNTSLADGYNLLQSHQ
ncbi:carbonic anhydrase, partial [candidate division WWE3 bacterium CG06_land_8_20_14_3_00_42_16]